MMHTFKETIYKREEVVTDYIDGKDEIKKRFVGTERYTMINFPGDETDEKVIALVSLYETLMNNLDRDKLDSETIRNMINTYTNLDLGAESFMTIYLRDDTSLRLLLGYPEFAKTILINCVASALYFAYDDRAYNDSEAKDQDPKEYFLKKKGDEVSLEVMAGLKGMMNLSETLFTAMNSRIRRDEIEKYKKDEDELNDEAGLLWMDVMDEDEEINHNGNENNKSKKKNKPLKKGISKDLDIDYSKNITAEDLDIKSTKNADAIDKELQSRIMHESNEEYRKKLKERQVWVKKVIKEGYAIDDPMQNLKSKDWVLTPYADALVKHMTKNHEIMIESDEASQNAQLRILERYNRNILTNKAILSRAVEAKDTYLFLNHFKKIGEESINKDYFERLIKEKLDNDDIKAVTDGVVSKINHDPDYEIVKKRQNDLRNEVNKSAPFFEKNSDLKEFWGNPAVEKLLLTKNDEEFKKLLSDVTVQYKSNIEALKVVISDNVSEYSREDLFKEIVLKMKSNLFISSTNVIIGYTDYICSNLMANFPKIGEKEKKWNDLFGELGVSSVYKKACSVYIKKKDIFNLNGTKASDFKEIPEIINNRNITFESKVADLMLTNTQWKKLEGNLFAVIMEDDWEEQIDKYISEYQAETTKDLKLNRVERLEGKKGEKLDLRVSKNEEMVKADIIEKILKNPLFGDVFAESTTQTMFFTALNRALLKGSVQEIIGCPKEVRSIEQFTTLSAVDYAGVLDNLTGIMAGTETKEDTSLMMDWSNIACMNKSSVQRHILEDILTGKVTKQNLNEKVNAELKKRANEKKLNRMRFDILLSKTTEEKSELEYNYFDVKGKDSTFGVKFKPTGRIKRNKTANAIWNQIDKMGDVEGIKPAVFFRDLISCSLSRLNDKFTVYKDGKLKNGKNHAIVKTEKYESFLKKMVSSLSEISKANDYDSLGNEFKTNKVIDISQIDSKEKIKCLSEIMKVISSTLKTENEYRHTDGESEYKLLDIMPELLLGGYGNEVLSYDGIGANTLLTYDDNDYLIKIMQNAATVMTNNLQLNTYLYAESNKISPEEKERIRNKLKPVIGGMVFDIHKNLEKFGISSMGEVVSAIESYYVTTDDYHKGYSQKVEDFAKVFDERRNMLRAYKGGKFNIIEKELMRNKDFWENFMKMTNEDYEKYLDELDQKCGKVLDVLMDNEHRKMYGINRFYIMNNSEKILNGELQGLNEMEAHAEIGKFYTKFNSYKIEGRDNIDDHINSVYKLQRVAKGIKNEGVFFWKDFEIKNDTGKTIYDLLNANPENYYILFSRGDLEAAIKKYLKNYGTNMEYLEAESEKIPKLKQILFFKKELLDNKKAVKDETKNSLKETIKSWYNGVELTDKQLENLFNGYASEAALFSQFIYNKAAMNNNEKFKNEFDSYLEEFFNLVGNIDTPTFDKKVLDKKEQTCRDIFFKKNRGEYKKNEYFKDFNEFGVKLDQSGSVILCALNTRKTFEQNDYNEAIEKVKEFLADTDVSDNIIDLLGERYLDLLQNTPDEKLRETIIRDDAYFLKTVDMVFRDNQKEISLHPLTFKDRNDFIVYYYSHKINVDMTYDKFSLDEKSIIDSAKSFIDSKTDYQRQMYEYQPSSSLLKDEFDNFVSDMTAALYLMPKAKRDEIKDAKIKYFRAMDQLYININAVIDDLLKNEEFKKNFNQSQRSKLAHGLYSYYTEDMIAILAEGREVKKDDFESLKRDIKYNLLENEDKDKCEMFRNYIIDSKSVMGAVSSKDLSEDEKDQVVGRDTFHKLLVNSSIEEIPFYYNRLNFDEQKLLAMFLSEPGQVYAGDIFKSNSVMFNPNEGELTQNHKENLAEYIKGGEFNPTIDYRSAVKHISKIDKKTKLYRISLTAFEKAYESVQVCSKLRAQSIPKEWDRLSDGAGSVKEVVRMLGANKEIHKKKAPIKKLLSYTTLTTAFEKEEFAGRIELMESSAKASDVGTFRNNLNALVDIDNVREGFKEKFVKGNNLIDRFNGLSDNDFYLLVDLLQDRTVLDYTTAGADSGKTKSFVNERKRIELLEKFNNPEDISKTLAGPPAPEKYKKAMETLFSYQLKDHVDTRGRLLSEKDFVNAGRLEAVDWDLLYRALEMLDEIKRNNNRIAACRQAVNFIADEKNAPNQYAKKEYEENYKAKFEDKAMASGDFEGFIKRHAKNDGDEAMALMMGYNSLSETEKKLFVRALEHRDVLDVSRNNLYMSYFGSADRDFVNPKERDDLINEYIETTDIAGKNTGLKMSEKQYNNAVLSLLTTQVDDSRDFEAASKAKENFAGQKFIEKIELKTNRKTAVDWKLFERALQLVKRTSAEKKTIDQNEELYRSQGNLLINGRFKFENNYLRKNLHSSGNRYNRYAGKRLVHNIKSTIPMGEFIKNTVVDYVVSDSTRNNLLKDNTVKPLESRGYADTVETAGVYGNMAVHFANMGNNYLIKDANVDFNTGNVAMIGIEIASSVMKGAKMITESVKGKKQLDSTAKSAEKYREDDKDRQKEAEEKQTEAEKELVNQALEDNNFLLKVSQDSAKSALTGDIIAAAELTIQAATAESIIWSKAGAVVGGAALLPWVAHTMINEVFTMINFIRQLRHDKKLLEKYYNVDSPFSKDVMKIRENAKNMLSDNELSKEQYDKFNKMSNVEMARKTNGFEGFDEQVSFVILNMVQGILYSASNFNPNLENRCRAVGVLTALGMKKYIGRQDTEAALDVYHRLCGDKYEVM
ncbi:MAG: hypothetical protein K6F00_06330 [Lachnospiraceae bacterium]|nr:hypothetical protein [Lachnospiraceae bacterium]